MRFGLTEASLPVEEGRLGDRRCKLVALEQSDLRRQLAEVHARHGQYYVAAPVLGNPDAVRARKLFLLASGAAAAVERVRPLLEPLGQRLFVVGEDVAGRSGGEDLI